MFANLKKDRFSADTVTLSVGTIIAQIIPVLSMLVFSRYYSDAVLGTYALFLQVVAIFSTIANGRLEQAFFLLNNSQKPSHVFISSVIFNALFCLFILAGCILLKLGFNSVFSKYQIMEYLFWIPLSIFFGGLVLSILFYLNFQGKFLTLSYVRIFQSLVANLIPLAFILINPLTPSGLILGFVLGQLVVALVFVHIKHIYRYNQPDNIWKQIVLPTFSRFRKLITVNSPLILVDQFAANIPLILIYTYFSDATAGQFSLAYRLLLLPAVVIGNSIGQVFYKNMSERRNSPVQAESLIKSTFKRLLFIAIILFSATFLLSEPIIPVIFGPGWETAGIIASLVSLNMWIRFVVSPLSSVLLVFEDYTRLALWQILNLVIQILLGIFTIIFKLDFFEYLYILVVVDGISYLFYFYLIYKSGQRHLRQTLYKS